MKSLVKEVERPVTWWNGYEPDIRAWLKEATSSYLREQIGELLITDHRLSTTDRKHRIDNKVNRYINILEKGFVIFPLSPFRRNLRNEIRESRKFIFTIMEYAMWSSTNSVPWSFEPTREHNGEIT